MSASRLVFATAPARDRYYCLLNRHRSMSTQRSPVIVDGVACGYRWRPKESRHDSSEESGASQEQRSQQTASDETFRDSLTDSLARAVEHARKKNHPTANSLDTGASVWGIFVSTAWVSSLWIVESLPARTQKSTLRSSVRQSRQIYLLVESAWGESGHLPCHVQFPAYTFGGGEGVVRGSVRSSTKVSGQIMEHKP